MKRLISETTWPLEQLELWGVITDFRLHRLIFYINRKLEVNMVRFHWNYPGHGKPVEAQPGHLSSASHNAPEMQQRRPGASTSPQAGFPYFLEISNAETASFICLIANRQEIPLPEGEMPVNDLHTRQPKPVFLEPKFKKVNAFLLRSGNALPQWDSLEAPLRKVRGIRTLVAMDYEKISDQLKSLPYFDPT